MEKFKVQLLSGEVVYVNGDYIEASTHLIVIKKISGSEVIGAFPAGTVVIKNSSITDEDED